MWRCADLRRLAAQTVGTWTHHKIVLCFGHPAYELVVHPDCRHAIDELTLYAYRTDPLTGDILPVLEDRHNPIIDALRYGLEALRRSGYRLLNLV